MLRKKSTYVVIVVNAIFFVLVMSPALAQESTNPIDLGDTAWMLMATGLVLLMTPGLAFFYGGLVRSRNVLNTMMMSFVSMALIGVTWCLFGYSLAFDVSITDAQPFGQGIQALIGGTDWFFLNGVTATEHDPIGYASSTLYGIPVDFCHYHSRPNFWSDRRKN